MWHLKATIFSLCLIIALVAAVPVDKLLSKSNSETVPIELPTEPIVNEDLEPNSLPSTLTPPRRMVEYDQRQDGHYNIRADLENFVILVVPSSAASGANLLDLLTRSQKRNHNKHVQKKYHPQSDKYEEKKSNGKLDYSKAHLAEPVEIIDVPHTVDEFIEGRTPYRVDISSTELLQPIPANGKVLGTDELMAARRADMSAATVVRAMTPGSGIAMRESITAPVSTGIKGNDEPTTIPSINRYRKSLTIEGNGNINTNSVLLTPFAQEQNQRIRDSGADIDVDGEQYQAVDVNEHRLRPEFFDLTDTSNSFDSLNVGNLDLATGNPNGSSNDDDHWQLELLGAQEQCGPDRRRDSYGVCQFVPSDYSP